MKNRNILLFCLSFTTILLVLVIGFEPKVRTYFQKSNIAPYRFKVSGVIDSSNQIEVLEKRIQRDPTAALDRAVLASTYVSMAKKTGDTAFYQKAEKLAKESLKSLPFSNNGAKLTLATIYEARHDFKNAIHLALEVSEQGSKREGLSILITSYLAIGNLQQASLYSDRLVNMKPSLGSYALRALVMNAQGRDIEAEFNFKNAITLEDIGEVEDSAWVRCLLGRFYLGSGKVNFAQDLFREALRIQPNYHFALSLLGEAEMEEGEYQKAGKYFFEAFSSSRQLVYFKNYGKALERQGKAKEAKDVLTDVERRMRAEIESKEYGHRNDLVDLLIYLKTEKGIKEAIALMNEELKVRQSAPTYYLMAKALYANSQWGEAKEAIQAIFRMGVKDRKYYFLAAQIEEKLGNGKFRMFYESLASNDKTNVVRDLH